MKTQNKRKKNVPNWVGLSSYLAEQLRPWHRTLPEELKAKFDPAQLLRRRTSTFLVALADGKLPDVSPDAAAAREFLEEYLEHPDVTLELMQQIRRLVFRPRSKREAITFALTCFFDTDASDDEIVALVDSTWNFRPRTEKGVTRGDVSQARRALAKHQGKK